MKTRNKSCCSSSDSQERQVIPHFTYSSSSLDLHRLFAAREKALTGQECENLLQDITSIATKTFSDHVDKVTCIHTLIESLLASGIAENIRLAGCVTIFLPFCFYFLRLPFNLFLIDLQFFTKCDI